MGTLGASTPLRLAASATRVAVVAELASQGTRRSAPQETASALAAGRTSAPQDRRRWLAR